MDTETLTIQQEWNMVYHHSAGAVGTEFFRRLRDEGKIAARVCPGCERTLLPPREFCDRCFMPTDDWREVALTGTIETFTIVYRRVNGLVDPPFVLAYVLLDGADTAVLNLVKGLDLEDTAAAVESLQIGTRVDVKLKPQDDREGRMTDFWFEPEALA